MGKRWWDWATLLRETWKWALVASFLRRGDVSMRTGATRSGVRLLSAGGAFLPGSSALRLFGSHQVVKALGSAGEPVVTVGEAGPEPCGEFFAEADEKRAAMPAKVPVPLPRSNGIGGAVRIELYLGRVDVLTDPEFVAGTRCPGQGC